jgi:hypothetical protein
MLKPLLNGNTARLALLLLAGGLGLLGCGDPNVPLTQPPPNAFRVSTPRPPRLDLYPTPPPMPTPTPTPLPSLSEITARWLGLLVAAATARDQPGAVKRAFPGYLVAAQASPLTPTLPYPHRGRGEAAKPQDLGSALRLGDLRNHCHRLRFSYAQLFAGDGIRQDGAGHHARVDLQLGSW